MNDLIRSIKSYIELEEAFGIRECVPCTLDMPPVRSAASSPAGASLEALKKAALSCEKCALHKTRTNVVFGAGSSSARLVFVGEAPGHDEDLAGLPFVGKAGELLTKIIEAMGLSREEVYIANILKCRPPDNRPPEPGEVKACQEIVRQQIMAIGPKAVCTLGKFASQTLLGSETPISALRGAFHDYNGIPVMPTFHPAYLLRNPHEKKLVWADMQKLMKLLGTKQSPV